MSMMYPNKKYDEVPDSDPFFVDHSSVSEFIVGYTPANDMTRKIMHKMSAEYFTEGTVLLPAVSSFCKSVLSFFVHLLKNIVIGIVDVRFMSGRIISLCEAPLTSSLFFCYASERKAVLEPSFRSARYYMYNLRGNGSVLLLWFLLLRVLQAIPIVQPPSDIRGKKLGGLKE